MRYGAARTLGWGSNTELAPSSSKSPGIRSRFVADADAVIHNGDCRDFLPTIPDESIRLVVTSPPYNIGKPYERKIGIDAYLDEQAKVIAECVRILSPGGSICWQVGNHVVRSEIVPLDILLYPAFRQYGLKLRNRVIWHFEHGLHCTRRLSGRHETILWFTKGDEYIFNLDPIRVPQKYPGKKAFKGPRTGEYTSHPVGKNPGDVWIIPNVKHNHVEKTPHPCQFPVELVERLVLALTNPGEWVVDPFMGVGSALIAALRHGRRAAGAEIAKQYVKIATDRIEAAWNGTLRTRPMYKPVYQPRGAVAKKPGAEEPQTALRF